MEPGSFLHLARHLLLYTARPIQSMPPILIFEDPSTFQRNLVSSSYVFYDGLSLRMKALLLFETSVALHRSARNNIPEDLYHPERRSENLKCRTVFAAVHFNFMLAFSYSIQAYAANRSSLFSSQYFTNPSLIGLFRWPTNKIVIITRTLRNIGNDVELASCGIHRYGTIFVLSLLLFLPRPCTLCFVE